MRSAISLINSEDTSKSLLLLRFFKGVFKLRPSTPRYNSTWDVNIVLNTLENWGLTVNLNLQKLTLKLVMLLALGTAFRLQSLALISLNHIRILKDGVEIRITDHIKTSRPGVPQPYAFFNHFENEQLCIAKTLIIYIQKTKKIRGNKSKLFISFKPPHVEVGTQTLSRWLKVVMKEAGISEEFKGQSTRHASTSKAFTKGMNINLIKDTAGWSKNSTVFARFYNRPITKRGYIFAKEVLS